MSVHALLIIAAVYSFIAGWWKIPSTQWELRNPLAPYRALTGALHILVGIVLWLASRGSL